VTALEVLKSQTISAYTTQSNSFAFGSPNSSNRNSDYLPEVTTVYIKKRKPGYTMDLSDIDKSL
jgi:hypothetical protein